jgi:hypothetical protein
VHGFTNPPYPLESRSLVRADVISAVPDGTWLFSVPLTRQFLPGYSQTPLPGLVRGWQPYRFPLFDFFRKLFTATAAYSSVKILP